MRLRRHFIVNAAAGGHSLRELRELQELCRRHGDPFSHRVCASWEEARRETRHALRGGADQIVALGGDGTVNAVVNGFFEHDANLRPEAGLALSAFGTGSDYLRGLRATRDFDWKEALFRHRIQKVDVGLVKAPALAEQRYFLNALTAGVTARIVAAKARSAGRLPKALAYAWPALRTLPGLRDAWHLKVRPGDGRHLERRVLALFLAKGAFVGAGMKVGGRVALDDGQLDLALVAPRPWPKLMLEFGRLLARGIREGDGIERQIVRELEVKGAETLPFEVDGEILGEGDFSVRLLPQALRLCVPV